MSMTLKEEVLRDYINDIFVETGSNVGGGIRLALKCGFKQVRSVEMTEIYYNICRKSFDGDERVKLYHQDSSNLDNVLRDIDIPVTFWLDSHTIPNDPNSASHGYNWKYCPVLNELESIARHHVKTHTILIDDMDAFGTPIFDNISIELVKDCIHNINPKYKLSYRDGKSKRDILVAQVK